MFVKMGYYIKLMEKEVKVHYYNENHDHMYN